VLMTRRVAERWIRSVALPEYRFKVLYGAKEIKNLTSLLYSFRDGKVTLKTAVRVGDLGVQERFDGIDLWSKDRVALMSLQQWFEKRGFDTTGIW